MTNIHQVQRAVDSRYESEDCLDNDAAAINATGAADFWYWYWSGSYEGSGRAILRFPDGRWADVDLSHCSCYGPTDDLPKEGQYESLDDLKAKQSADSLAELAEIIAAIEANA